MDTNGDHHEYCTGGFKPDDIVISGVSGRFPCCSNVGELKDALFAQKNLFFFSRDRYDKGAAGQTYGAPCTISGLDKFDYEFFCIPTTLASAMDPVMRKCMELSYEAIADSGYDVTDLKGADIAIYNACCSDDTKDTFMAAEKNLNTSMLLGIARSMHANMCSRVFDFHGPSFSLDSACSSSTAAFWCAYNDIREGRAEAAVVNACQVNLNPVAASLYDAIASPSMKCCPLDDEADGIVRSEAATAIFLQKASVARRAYATVLAANQVSAGYVPEGVAVPSLPMQVRLYEKNLKESGMTPEAIDFIEVHGTGTTVGDPIELGAISQVYNRNRKKALYVGTIKSNLGHSESASGISSIIKALVAFETGFIPPNFNFKTPNQKCPALVKGEVKVVTETIPLSSSCIPVNNFGIGGTLVQIVLKQNSITYAKSKAQLLSPRLVLYSASTEEAVLHLLRFVENNGKLTREFFALLNKLSFTPILVKPFRGYALLQNTKCIKAEVKQCFRNNQEVWFVMTGMGCQWLGMGLDLMELNVFAESMNKSAETLKPLGIDLFELLRKDKDYMNTDRRITPAFVTIAAIQIALLDVLKAANISPDGIVGHSVGELTAAYADGCCTAKQTILSAYWRGKSVEMSNLPSGAMAAVGLSWDEAKKCCPANVYPACHNADDSVTISGLKKPTEDFVAELQEKNVFSRCVNVYGYSFHSKLIEPAAELLRPALKKIFPSPKQRSKRWVSSSYLENEWNSENCKLAGAEYFTHNLISAVHFNEAAKKIPSDAIVIEIGPHCLLQALLKRVIGSRATYIGLMNKNEENNLNIFFESLGKMYAKGLDPKIENLYPPVKFPVPRSTPMISDLIRWNHAHTFPIVVWNHNDGAFIHTFDMKNTDSFLMDHFIDGRSLFPAAGYIYLAWSSFAREMNSTLEETSIVIEDFKIHRAVILNESADLKFRVYIQNAGRRFEIVEGTSLLSSGVISREKDVKFVDPEPERLSDECVLSGEDIYNEIRIRGYQYGPAFKGLLHMNLNGTLGAVSWNGNWITFLDSLLLFFGIVSDKNALFLPTGAESIKINPNVIQKYMSEKGVKKERAVPVTYNMDARRCRSVGVEIKKLVLDPAPLRAIPDVAMYTKYDFIPYNYNYIPSQAIKKKLSSYKSACNAYLDKIGNILKKDMKAVKFLDEGIQSTDFDLQLDDTCTDHILLTVLKQISNCNNSINFMENAKEQLHYYVKNIEKDLLNNILIDECPIRIMLDIVSENTYRKLNLLELNRSDSIILLPTIMDIVKRDSFTVFKNTLLASPPDSNCVQNAVEKYGIHWRSSTDLSSLYKERNMDLVVSSFIYGTLTELRNHMHELSSLVKSNGFILLYFKGKTTPAEFFLSSAFGECLPILADAEIQKLLKDENLTVVSKISDSIGGFLYLFRHIVQEIPHQVMHIRDDSCDWVEELKAHLSKDTPENLMLVSDHTSSGIIGMVNCLKREPGGEKIRCVFILQPANKSLPAVNFKNILDTDQLKNNLLMNVWCNGEWGSFRHISLEKEKLPRVVEHSFIDCKKYGDLSSFEWKESSVQYIEAPKEEIVHIYYSALNFRDVMLATGKLSIGTAKDFDKADACVLGLEFSGRRPSGRRVAGLLKGNGLATSTLADPGMCFDVPEHWTLEEAATVPVVYATCFYALLVRGKLQKGESILIHSGTGGTGQAAIAIALEFQCEIFTTVGNEQKKEYLRLKYPQIKPENIGCSRDLSFEDMISDRTGGKGVNIVLNSLADEKFQASLRCLSKHGRFLEIGKYDLSLDRPIGLKVFLKNVNFHGVSLDQIMDGTPEANAHLHEVMKLLRDGCKNNVVKPLDTTVFESHEAEKAFRYMAGGTHIGKVLLKIREEESTRDAIPAILRMPAVPNTLFYDHKVYIVIGGLGGFGIEITKWMLNRRANYVILTSRYGVRSSYHQLCLKRWKEKGFHVQISTRNVAKRDEAELLLKEASAIGPVGGIFNSAVVLRDAFIENQDAKMFKEVCEPKATATRNLDELSRKMCPDLDYFVCFSSISCGRGNAGQSNYGYANSVMERICEQRRSIGLHGLAIQWGIIGDVGVVHRHMGDDAVIAGVCAQGVNSCLSALDVFCQLKHPVVSTFVTAASIVKSATAKDDVIPKVMHILGLTELSETNRNRTFMELGIDSMMGTELVQLIEATTDVSLAIRELQQMKVDDLISLLNKSKSENETKKKTSVIVTTAHVNVKALLMPTKTIVPLNAVETGAPIFIVAPGLADISLLHALAASISKPFFALLWTRDVPANDMQTLATWCRKEIEMSSCGAPFHLVGFSICGSLAFEMAIQDQKADSRIKTFSLLDGSTALVNAVGSGGTDSEVTSLCKFVELFIQDGVPKLAEELEDAADLDQKIRIVAGILSNCSTEPVSESEISIAIHSYLNRMALVQTYVPLTKLEKDLTVIEDSSRLLANDVSEFKETLSEVCSKKIIIHRKVLECLEISSKENGPGLAELLNNVFENK